MVINVNPCVSTIATRYYNKVEMVTEDLDETQSYVVNLRWLLEGIIVPSVGIVGIIGKSCWNDEFIRVNQ